MNTNIILCTTNAIYISKFKNQQYFIIKTNLEYSYEVIIASWICSELSFKNTNISVYNDIFFAVTQEEDKLIIRKINVYKKKIELERVYSIIGNKLDISNVICINENNIIIFLEEVSSFSYDGFLFNLLENKNYHIKDRRLIDTHQYNFEIYNIKKEFYICFGEKYMTDWEKEEIYRAVKARKILVNDCFESLNIIKVKDFINAIKMSLDIIPFTIIDTRSTRGLVRYIFMDNLNIYYRIKDFDDNIEKIYSISKIRLKKKLIKIYNYNA